MKRMSRTTRLSRAGRDGRAGSRGVRRPRWVAAALGLAALGAYLAGAWLSGSLSPMARRALLDTSFVPQPYRWVNPPSSLAPANKPPDRGEFTVAFSNGKSDAGVFATNDQQASVVLSLAAIPTATGATSVHMTIDPLDPATVGSLPDDLHPLGNAYRIRATYEPGGQAVTRFSRAPLLLMVYPALVSHGLDRAIEYSPDGKAWTKLKTTVDATNLQASTNPRSLNGYFEVATRGAVSASGTPSPGPGGGGGGSSPVAWIVIAAAIVVAAALAVVRLRSRAREREFDSYRGADPAGEPGPGDAASQEQSAAKRQASAGTQTGASTRNRKRKR
jgi:hypothetical protein